MKDVSLVIFMFVAITVCLFGVLWVLGYDIERRDRLILILLVSFMVYRIL